MTDCQGTPITDGARIRVMETDFHGQLVPGVFGKVDFLENNPEKVAVTTQGGFELYLRPSLVMVIN